MEYKEFVLPDHLKEPYNAMVDHFKTNNYTSVDLATGLGKTIITEKLIADNFGKRFLIVVPNRSIKTDHMNNIRKYCTRQNDNGEIEEPSNIECMCYNSINKVMNNENAYDFVVLDEYHHAGGDVWESQVKKLMESNPNCKFLGTSATPKRSDGKNMSDILFGHQSSYIGLGDAIEETLLAPMKIYCVAYQLEDGLKIIQENAELGDAECKYKFDKIIERVKTQTTKANMLSDFFDKVIPEKHGKYIVFCPDAAQMKFAMDDCDSWFSGTTVSKYSIYHRNSEEKINKAINDFIAEDASDKIVLLFNIAMIGEGSHIDNLDGVISFRPTRSTVKYIQQLGRPLTMHWKETGKNPKIIDITNSVDELRILLKSKRKVGNIDLREKSNIPISFHVEENCRDIMEIINYIESIINSRSSFDIGFKHAKAYYEEHGDLLVPFTFICEDDYKLGQWIMYMRSKFKKNKLEIDEKCKLDSIEMVWVIHDYNESFNTGFEHAKAYYEEHGDLLVPSTFVCDDSFKLGNWIVKTRQKKNKLDHYRKNLLESIGIVWNTKTEIFNTGFEHAKAYYEEHGDLLVPRDFICKDGYKLGGWISNKRMSIKKNQLSQDQISQLDSIGMVWKARVTPAESFDIGFEHAKAYYEEHGDLLVPQNFICEDGYKLYYWISDQRSKFKNKKLDKNNIAKLESINLILDTSARLNIGLEHAKAYYEEHGDLLVPQNFICEDGYGLGRYISGKRSSYKSGEITLKDIRELEAIGMIWVVREK